MGQKANPNGLRVGIIRDWDSTWFSVKDYGSLLVEDLEIRKYLRDALKRAGVSKVLIRRKADQVDVDIYAARPGIVIGRGGSDISILREDLGKKLNKRIQLNIIEEKHPELSARLVGENIVAQLEKRIPFRRAMKSSIQRVMKAGASGIKVCCSGRLGGLEIARTERYHEGKVPLHTFRADIDYAFSEALTTYGKIGVKVWIYKGDIVAGKSGQAISSKELAYI
ncbi:MAG: 30S ribosomal protein S3 [Candidatus Margulisiibacteriota bacterium]|jgi:small subunit ribosomal protein S3